MAHIRRNGHGTRPQPWSFTTKFGYGKAWPFSEANRACTVDFRQDLAEKVIATFVTRADSLDLPTPFRPWMARDGKRQSLAVYIEKRSMTETFSVIAAQFHWLSPLGPGSR